MSLRRFALVLLGLAAAIMVVAPPVGAKDGVKATLTSSLPLDASPGTRLDVAWRLFSTNQSGKREPFGANGVFVRLRSASGAEAEEGFAPDGDYATGEYEATVVVPRGGIGGVEIGLLSWRSGAGGTRRADAIFPITNDPLPGVARVVAPASSELGPEARESDSAAWIFILVGGALAALAVVAVTVALRRRRDRKAPPAAARRTSAGEAV